MYGRQQKRNGAADNLFVVAFILVVLAGSYGVMLGIASLRGGSHPQPASCIPSTTSPCPPADPSGLP